MKPLPIMWTAHKSNYGAEKGELEQAIRNSTVALTRMLEIVEKKIQEVDDIEISDQFYNQEGWAYAQAYLNGKKHAYTDLKKLLSFLK